MRLRCFFDTNTPSKIHILNLKLTSLKRNNHLNQTFTFGVPADNFQGCIYLTSRKTQVDVSLYFSFRNWDFRLHTWYVWKRSSGVLRPVSGIWFHHSVASQPERKFAWAKCLGKITGNWKGGKPSSSSQQTAVVAVYIEGFQSDSGHVHTGFTNIPSELSFRLPVLGIPLTTNKKHDSSNVSNCKSYLKKGKENILYQLW